MATASVGMSRLRHSKLTSAARWGLRWFHRLKYRDGAPFKCTVAPGFDFQIYPKGELTEFLSLGPLFERTEMKLVAGLFKPGMRVVDAGANIGLYFGWYVSARVDRLGPLSLRKPHTVFFSTI